ncbi:MAG: hypothetical protein ED559_04785 [Phycisphaera sp.]|nr:MAG: hypothetical protein ED559_04785 [Phycisphaera sp.]
MSAHCSNCLSSNVIGVEAASVCTECASLTVAGTGIGAPVIGAALLAVATFVVAYKLGRKIRLTKPTHSLV